MSLKEVIRNTGDIRRTLAQTMIDVRSGDISVDKGIAGVRVDGWVGRSRYAEDSHR